MKLNIKQVVKIPIFVFLTWVLIHFLGLFGVFLAIIYPFFWILAPKKTPCFLSYFKKGPKSPPKNFFSVLVNSLFIFLISLFCFTLVLLESKTLLNLSFPIVPKTVTFIIPTKGQYYLQEVFPMKIEITGIQTTINAIQTDFSFDQDIVEVVDISTDGSFANIFIQKEIDNKIGYVRLTGGLPNPGFNEQSGIFGTVYFRGKNPGLTKIEFLPSSMVLANDSKGTNVLKEIASAAYIILPEEIPEEEKKKQESLIQRKVLGEETQETQMKFYEEDKILGEKPPQETEPKYVFKTSFLSFLEQVNRLILNFWSKILLFYS